MSREQRLDQLAEETSGDEQLHPAGRCGARQELRPKRGVDGHLYGVGAHAGGLGVDNTPTAFPRGAGIVHRYVVEMYNTDCSGDVFLVY